MVKLELLGATHVIIPALASCWTVLQGFLAEGLQRTTAGLGSVIIDSQPLSVALLAALLFGEELTAASYVGLALGVLGLCLLEVPVETLAAAPQTVLGRHARRSEHLTWQLYIRSTRVVLGLLLGCWGCACWKSFLTHQQQHLQQCWVEACKA